MSLIRITSDIHADIPAMERLAAGREGFAMTIVAGDLMDMFALKAGLQRQREVIFDWINAMVSTGHWLAWCDGNHDHGLRVPPANTIISPGQTQLIPRLAVVTSLPWDPAGWEDRLLTRGNALREQSSLPWIVVSHRPPAETTPENANFEEDAHVELMLQTHTPDFYCCGHAHEAPYHHGDCLWTIGKTKVINPGRREEGINTVMVNLGNGALVWER